MKWRAEAATDSDRELYDFAREHEKSTVPKHELYGIARTNALLERLIAVSELNGEICYQQLRMLSQGKKLDGESGLLYSAQRIEEYHKKYVKTTEDLL